MPGDKSQALHRHIKMRSLSLSVSAPAIRGGNHTQSPSHLFMPFADPLLPGLICQAIARDQHYMKHPVWADCVALRVLSLAL
jgi:hypothetical protein